MYRTIARGALIVVVAIVAYVYYVPLGHADFVGRWGDGTDGVRFPVAGAPIVLSVDPGSPAQRAGVRPGDRMVVRPFTREAARVGSPQSGATQDAVFVRPDGSRYRVRLTAVPVANFSWGDRLGGILAILPGTLFLIIAFALVYLRPSVMTWSFALYAIGYLSTAPSFEYFGGASPSWFYLPMSFVLTTAFGAFAPLWLVPFVLRFPNNELRGGRKKIDLAIWFCLAAAYLGYAYEWYSALAFQTLPPYASLLDNWLPPLALVASAVIIIANYKTAPPERRQRVRFLVLGFIISVLAYATYYVPDFSDATKQIVGYAVVFMPIGVAYAVLQYRVLDISFVLNRAIAYAMVSIAVIAFVSLLDWLFGRIVSSAHFATIVELVITIGLGFLLDRISRFAGGAVESVLFRKRHEAERFLRRVAGALPYATVEESITDSLLHEPVEALELTAAALYRRSRDDRRYDGIATSEGTMVAPAGFERDHNLVRFLKAEERVVWLDEVRSHLDPENSRVYVLAVPILVRHELESFVLYGAHRNGTQIDPDEVRLLEELAREAARAYDHVDAVRTRELLAQLRATEVSPGTA